MYVLLYAKVYRNDGRNVYFDQIGRMYQMPLRPFEAAYTIPLASIHDLPSPLYMCDGVTPMTPPSPAGDRRILHTETVEFELSVLHDPGDCAGLVEVSGMVLAGVVAVAHGACAGRPRVGAVGVFPVTCSQCDIQVVRVVRVRPI